MSSEDRDEGSDWKSNVADGEAGVELLTGSSSSIQLTGSFRDLAASIMTNGDTVSAAVEGKRCIREPLGCGRDLLKDDGTPRFDDFATKEEAQLYETEWRMTGMCPTCQDRAEAVSKAMDQR